MTRRGPRLSAEKRWLLVQHWRLSENANAVAEAHGVTAPTVMYWVKRWKEGGKPALQNRKYPARSREPSRLKQEWEWAIVHLYLNYPEMGIDEIAENVRTIAHRSNGSRQVAWKTVKRVLADFQSGKL